VLLAGFTCTTASPQSELDQLLPWRRATKRAAARQLEAPNEVEAARLEKELEEEDESALMMVVVVSLLGLAATFGCGHVLEHKHVDWLPEAAVGVLAGIVVSAITYYCGFSKMLRHEKFNFSFFMDYLLPPIIFEAGFNMNVNAFVDNLGPTMFFAFVGTFGSTFVVGGIVYFAGQIGMCYPLPLLGALVFGSLISATDPVTVLAVFQALGVKVDLFSMVFGESVLNDAVAIVLSTTLLSFNDPEVEVNTESIMGAVTMFLTIFVGSLIIGLVYGLASALMFKKLDLRHHKESIFLESALSFTFPWAAYYTAEANHLSGIVTILFCGMVMATYTRCNFSPDAIELTARAYKCVALLAETFVFVYLGFALFAFPILSHTVYGATMVAIVACFIGRLHIYIGSSLVNGLRSAPAAGETQVGLPKISKEYMWIMWFSGLRGGVAFALASVSYADDDFPTSCGGIDEAARETRPECSPTMSDSLAILQMTLIIATLTIFVFGGMITSECRKAGVLEDKKKKKQPKKEETAEDENAWDKFNNHVLMPLLTFEERRVKEQGARYEAVTPPPNPVDEIEDNWAKARAVLAAQKFSAGKHSHEVKATLSSEELEEALRGVVTIEETSLEDKVDEVRRKLPAMSTNAVKKLLMDAGENVQHAVSMGQSKAPELL
jgi:sodium/hydrogen exchanger 8